MDRRKHLSECIDVIVRAIIVNDAGEKILFCSPKDKRYYYLPGGHVEFGETSKKALKRELLEETGIKVNEADFIFVGTEENIFLQKGQKRHEMNIYFRIAASSLFLEEIVSREDHIVFSWIPFSALAQFPILPASVKKTCEEFAKNREVKWGNM